MNTKHTLKCTIDGMHCVSCALNIDGALEDTAGVLSSSTKYASATTTVTFDPNLVDQQKLVQVIQSEGYTVSNVVES